MITSVISQFFVILLFLMLGVLLYIFAGSQGIQVEKSDELFPLIATGNYFPTVVGILFIIGLISSAYSAAGSALTALTTSFTVDILGTRGRTEEEIVKIRKRVHIGMAVIMGITIFVFNLLNNTSVIDGKLHLWSYLGTVCFRHLHEAAGAGQIHTVSRHRIPASLLHPAKEFGSMVQRLSVQL